jgi:hypothetical protein
MPGGEGDPGAGWWLDGGGLGRLFGGLDLKAEVARARRVVPTDDHSSS